MPEVFNGLILDTQESGEHHLTATLFSPEKGVVKVLGRYARAKRSSLKGLLAPFHVVELHVLSSSRGFPLITSGTLVRSFSNLRESLSLLNAGCKLQKAILDSQFEGKPSPLLYGLLLKYLEALPSSPPENMVSSFLLKLLRHEGLLRLEPFCGVCHEELKVFAFEDGVVKCPKDAQHKERIFSQEESEVILALGLTTSLHLLQQLGMPQGLEKKIETLFSQTLN